MQFLYGLEHCSDSSLRPFEGKPCARYPLEPKAPSASSSSPSISRTGSRTRSCRRCSPLPIMVMENAALNAIRAYLDPGESAVGTVVNVHHLAATPVGRLVTGEAEVTKVDGRQIEFTVRATEGDREIGGGSRGE